MITEKGPGQPAPPGKPERQDGQEGQRGQEGPASGGASGRAVRRVARNSVAPFAANLVGRAVAIVLAVVMARTLGASGTGLYAVAVNLWLYASIVADFGLGTWLTREVARLAGTGTEHRAQARRTVADALGLRLILSALALPLLLIAGLIAGAIQGSGPDRVLLATLALLGVGLLPGAVSAAGTALFNAYEEMTFPAAVQLGTAVATTGAGAALLLLGFDVVALGWVSLLVNLATAAVFAVACARRFFPLSAHLRPARQLILAREALPLMLNSLLNNVFFRFDVQVLQSKGTAAVGYYANAYKLIDAAGAVPSSFVLALFPLLARRAAGDEGTGGAGAGVSRVYRLAAKLLVATALAIAVPVTYLAADLVLWLWGPDFLPDSAIALSILIWFLPLSFFNGLTQYVLIAIGRQSRITLAFVVAALFNVGANLLLIPRYGYVAAAAVTIASEVVLLVPFLVALRGRIAAWPVLRAALRPVPAAAAVAVVLLLGRDVAEPWRLLLAAAATAVYPLLLLVSGVFDPGERRLLQGLLPARLRGWLPAG
jgi:O-antigen/teichoic acid export membrane protein